MNLSAALTTFEDHLPDIRKACVENIQAITASNQPAKKMSDEDAFTVENIKLHLNHLTITDKAAPMLRTVKRIDGRKQHYAGNITDADIEHARETPIIELWQELVGTPVRAGMTKCCFHDDKTASMSLRKYNRYRCFGCDAKGGTIDLYMHVNKAGFVQAVKALCA